MRTCILPADEPKTITIAISRLIEGGVVAFPTDTVYGLGALVSDYNAIDLLFQVKGRQSDKAIAVLVGNLNDITCLSEKLDLQTHTLAKHFWPGALTLVVKRNPGLPKNLSPSDTIGIRMPDHPVALKILKQTGPLAVSSANLSGNLNAVTAQDVYKQLRGRIPLIIDDGITPGGMPSTVVDCTGKQLIILRKGPISFDQLTAALQ